MKEEIKRGGQREGAGRKKIEGGVRHTWTVPTDVDEVVNERGTSWLWDAARFKVVFEKMIESLKGGKKED